MAREPLPFRQEIDFILKESARYLARGPTRADVKSVWVGLRPLVKPADDSGTNTKGLSREHSVLLSRSGLVTVTGGKWTTYRAMAEDVLRVCAAAELIPLRPQGADSATAAGRRAKRQLGCTPSIGIAWYADLWR